MRLGESFAFGASAFLYYNRGVIISQALILQLIKEKADKAAFYLLSRFSCPFTEEFSGGE